MVCKTIITIKVNSISYMYFNTKFSYLRKNLVFKAYRLSTDISYIHF
jgi:hypothetical protein